MRGALLSGSRDAWLRLAAAPQPWPRTRCHAKPSARPSGPALPPDQDFDSLVLDDQFYKELNMTMEDVRREQDELTYDVDPDAVPADEALLRLLEREGKLPPGWQQQVSSLEAYGPPAVLMAGFQIEEYAMTRAVLDEAGATAIKVLPVTPHMLTSSVGQAIHEEEVDWAQPRPDNWVHGGAVGAQRTILFSGLDLACQATVLELLEGLGLPPICVTMALEAQADQRLGEVLALAVKSQRQQRLPKQQLWQQSGRGTATDLEELAPLDQLINQQMAKQRADRIGAEGEGRVADEEADAFAAWFQRDDSPVYKINLTDEDDSQQQQQQQQQAAAAAPVVTPAEASTAAPAAGSSSSGKQPGKAAKGPLFNRSPQSFLRRRQSSATGGGGAAAPTSSSSQAPPQAPSADDGMTDDWGRPLGVDLDELLSDLGPPQAAAAAADTSSSSRGMPLSGSSSSSSSSSSRRPREDSALSRVQAALQQGASPEEVQQLLQQMAAARDRQAAAAADAADDIVSSTQQQNGAPVAPTDASGGAGGSSSSSSGGSSGQQVRPKSSLAAKLLQKRAAGSKPGVTGDPLLQRKSPVGRAAAAAPPLGSSSGSSEGSWRAPSNSSVARLERTADGRWVEAPVSPAGVTPAKKRGVLEPAAAAGVSPEVAAAAAAAKAAGPQEGDPAEEQPTSPPSVGNDVTPPRPYGPEPPPQAAAAGDLGSGSSSKEGLLQLRPDVQRAFAEKRIQFVDLSKLPSKYRQQYVDAARQQKQKQQVNMQRALEQQQLGAEGVELGQEEEEYLRAAALRFLQQERAGPSQEKLARDAELLRAQQQRLAARQGGAVNVPTAAAGSGASPSVGPSVEPSVSSTADVSTPDVEVAAAGFGGGEGEEEMQGPELSSEQLLEMKAAAAAQGLSLERALAEAIVCGVRVPPEAAAAAGVALPGADALAEARQQMLDMLNDVDWDSLGLGDATDSLAALSGLQQGEQDGIGSAAAGQPAVRVVESDQGRAQRAEAAPQVAKSRRWGASLKRRPRSGSN